MFCITNILAGSFIDDLVIQNYKRRPEGSGVSLDEPGNPKGIVKNKKRSRKSCKETDDHHLRRAPARLPSASSLARRLLLLLAMELLGVLVLKKESLDWQRLGKQRTW
jgi:hypothetical protein